MQPQIRQAAQPQVQGRALEFLTEPFALTRIGTGTSGLRATYRRPLLAVLFVVGLVLLLACANIANLQLARAAARGHEWSLRRALGASRWRLARPLVIESLLMAALGAGGGLAFASWASRLVVAGMSTASNRIALGGAAFAQSLTRLGLVDEYRLVLQPIALGRGLPLFKDLVVPIRFELVEAETYRTGAALHVYHVVR
jgi:ABC-type antimicrobial peptide transport system permease subunit